MSAYCCRFADECAFKVISTDEDSDIDGMKVILSCFKRHVGNVDIVDGFSALLLELTEYGEMMMMIGC